jgi:hypothetical protein
LAWRTRWPISKARSPSSPKEFVGRKKIGASDNAGAVLLVKIDDALRRSQNSVAAASALEFHIEPRVELVPDQEATRLFIEYNVAL